MYSSADLALLFFIGILKYSIPSLSIGIPQRFIPADWNTFNDCMYDKFSVYTVDPFLSTHTDNKCIACKDPDVISTHDGDTLMPFNFNLSHIIFLRSNKPNGSK